MLASAEAGYTIFIIVFMMSSLLNIAYLMPVVARGFFAILNRRKVLTMQLFG